MSPPIAARLAALRGTLPAEEPGARGMEQAARNPTCQRRNALFLAGIAPATAATRVHGEPDREGQSPFALSAGIRFETRLYEHGGAQLLALYRKHGRLALSESKVALPTDRSTTLRLLGQKLAGHPDAPNLIIQPQLSVPLLGIGHTIKPDVLVASDAEAFYRPVEVKSYADRAGKTAQADLRSACRQNAVAVVGLRTAVARLGASDPEILVPADGDLVLKSPGSSLPTLRPMALAGELWSLENVLRAAPSALATLEGLLRGIGPRASLDDPAVLDAIPNNYVPSCAEHCPLAKRCKRQAQAQGDPGLLGAQAREEFAAAGSLSRVLDLLGGRGGPPRTTAERDLAVRLRETAAELQRAV